VLQREEEQLLAEEAPVGLVALATVRGELCKALTDSQLQLLGDWLGESPGGVPLVEMYMKQELSAAATPNRWRRRRRSRSRRLVCSTRLYFGSSSGHGRRGEQQPRRWCRCLFDWQSQLRRRRRSPWRYCGWRGR